MRRLVDVFQLAPGVMLLVVIVLYSLTGVFEAAGLLLAGRGFYRTWVEFRH